jgi:hypothetical protein
MLATTLMAKLIVRGVLSPFEASETFDASLKVLDAGMSRIGGVFDSRERRT